MRAYYDAPDHKITLKIGESIIRHEDMDDDLEDMMVNARIEFNASAYLKAYEMVHDYNSFSEMAIPVLFDYEGDEIFMTDLEDQHAKDVIQKIRLSKPQLVVSKEKIPAGVYIRFSGCDKVLTLSANLVAAAEELGVPAIQVIEDTAGALAKMIRDAM